MEQKQEVNDNHWQKGQKLQALDYKRIERIVKRHLAWQKIKAYGKQALIIAATAFIVYVGTALVEHHRGYQDALNDMMVLRNTDVNRVGETLSKIRGGRLW